MFCYLWLLWRTISPKYWDSRHEPLTAPGAFYISFFFFIPMCCFPVLIKSHWCSDLRLWGISEAVRENWKTIGLVYPWKVFKVCTSNQRSRRHTSTGHAGACKTPQSPIHWLILQYLTAPKVLVVLHSHISLPVAITQVCQRQALIRKKWVSLSNVFVGHSWNISYLPPEMGRTWWTSPSWRMWFMDISWQPSTSPKM